MPDSRPAAARRARLPRRHLQALNASFQLTLEQEGKSPRTVEAYTDAVRLLAAYCEAHGLPLLAEELTRDHVRAFIADQLARWKPATAHQRYRSLRKFFTWACEEAVIERSPMARMKPPHLPEQPVAVVHREQLARLLKTCAGRDFASTRDTA